MDLQEGSFNLIKIACIISASSFCYLLMSSRRENSIVIRSVSQVVQESDRLIGKTVKIEGLSRKTDNLANKLAGYGKAIFKRVFLGKAKQKKIPQKFQISDGKNFIKVKLTPEPFISANVNFEQNNFINKIFSFFTISSSDKIIFDRRFTVSGIDEYIKNNSKCIVRGTLIKGKKGLEILSDSISSHVDLKKLEADRNLNISKKVAFASITIFAMAWVFKKCYSGNLNFFSKKIKNDEAPIHSNICAICFDNPCETIFFPCMHLVTCKKCVVANNCIICRSPIQKTEVIEFREKIKYL